MKGVAANIQLKEVEGGHRKVPVCCNGHVGELGIQQVPSGSDGTQSNVRIIWAVVVFAVLVPDVWVDGLVPKEEGSAGRGKNNEKWGRKKRMRGKRKGG